MGVVTVVSDETRSLRGLETPEHGPTAMLDNVICLHDVERRAELRKLVSIEVQEAAPVDR
jgi:hypothetical protein